MKPVMELIRAYARIIRFVVAGGTGAVVNLTALYIFVHFFGLYPVYGSAASFVCAFFVSFLLQKLWTYKNYKKDTAGKQMMTYFFIQLINLGLNIGAMFVLVEFTPLHYLAAQVLTSGLIAIESFFVYKYFVFHEVEVVLEKNA